ncbi:hypothetical protein [Brevundimonas vesicularis]|uniref:hypothetical protein n=1 Tax=Brevundimonas vesicularis TaxID=41276 RepID=UPI0022AC0F06|nr:hypothetical protein [Brevundimonas vesicularis]
MNKGPTFDRFQQALLDSVSGLVPTPEMKAAFNEDLLSESGAKERNPFSDSQGEYRFKRLAFSFIMARQALITSASTRKVILRLASLPLSERAHIVFIQSWDSQYTARERLRNLVDLLKLSPCAAGLEADIKKEMAAYKKQSDSILYARHRHTHEYDAHHPLVEQLKTLELLSSDAVSDKNFVALMTSRRKDAERRTKSVLIQELKDQEERFLTLTDQAFENVFSLPSKWPF